jgi:hypothetical protein
MTTKIQTENEIILKNSQKPVHTYDKSMIVSTNLIKV